jgi:hypothetical protein
MDCDAENLPPLALAATAAAAAKPAPGALKAGSTPAAAAAGRPDKLGPVDATPPGAAANASPALWSEPTMFIPTGYSTPEAGTGGAEPTLVLQPQQQQHQAQHQANTVVLSLDGGADVTPSPGFASFLSPAALPAGAGDTPAAVGSGSAMAGYRSSTSVSPSVLYAPGAAAAASGAAAAAGYGSASLPAGYGSTSPQVPGFGARDVSVDAASRPSVPAGYEGSLSLSPTGIGGSRAAAAGVPAGYGASISPAGIAGSTPSVPAGYASMSASPFGALGEATVQLMPAVVGEAAQQPSPDLTWRANDEAGGAAAGSTTPARGPCRGQAAWDQQATPQAAAAEETPSRRMTRSQLKLAAAARDATPAAAGSGTPAGRQAAAAGRTPTRRSTRGSALKAAAPPAAVRDIAADEYEQLPSWCKAQVRVGVCKCLSARAWLHPAFPPWPPAQAGLLPPACCRCRWLI